MNTDNPPKYWQLSGTHKLNATVALSKVPKSYAVPSSFGGYPLYFKAGDDSQSSSSSSTIGALVHVYALSFSHS